MKDYRTSLRRRVEAQRVFHGRREPGDRLVLINWHRAASLEGFLCERLNELGDGEAHSPRTIDATIEEYVRRLRESYTEVLRYEDDTVPAALVYAGIGAITAAMTGLEPFHDGTTSWLEPNLSWDQIERLRFDPDNKWVRFALRVNQALCRLWEEDFHILPYLHRSPLDAANGIRGTELFTEMYTAPDRVRHLLDWCVDWQLAMEKHLADNSDCRAPREWGTAVWGTWLPGGSVFVNGDPVGLISREMALEFEQPYTERLFCETAGGFYHNHTVGLYQTDLVSDTRGTLVQYFVDDPKHPSAMEALLDDAERRDLMLGASLKVPIALNVALGRLDEMLEVAGDGRFLLVVGIDPEEDDPDDVLRKVRKASELT